MQPGATTRKSAQQVERQNSEVSYYADDEDANRKKYTRRGEKAGSFKYQGHFSLFHYIKK